MDYLQTWPRRTENTFGKYTGTFLEAELKQYAFILYAFAQRILVGYLQN